MFACRRTEMDKPLKTRTEIENDPQFLSDANEARRLRWILEHPDAARGLLLLLKEERGDKISFRSMVDRVQESAERRNGNTT